MNGAADERPSGKRKDEPGQPAHRRGDRGGTQQPAASRRRHAALNSPRGDGIPDPRGSADDESLERPADADAQAHERFEAPSGDPLDGEADEAATERRASRRGRPPWPIARPPRPATVRLQPRRRPVRRRRRR